MASKDPDARASQDDSPLEIFDSEQPPSRAPRALMWTGLVVVILAGAYVAAQWAVSDKLPSGTTVAGIAVGGLTTDDAVVAIQDGLKGPAAQPIPVRAGEKTGTLDPIAAGLSVDASATVESLAGFSLAPAHLWDSLFGGGEVAPVISVDDDAFSSQFESLAASLTTEPIDGRVVFTEGAATLVEARDGQVVESEAARDRIVENWLMTSEPIELPVEAEAPVITQEQTEEALREAKQFISAPVAVSVGGQLAELPVKTLAEAASYVPDGNKLKLELDADALKEAVRARTKNLETKAKNARFEFKDGKPVITGGRNGTSLDGRVMAEKIGQVATSKGERTADVELTKVEPKQSKAKLKELGIKEVVGEFTTPLGASDAARVHNLVYGSQKVTGSLIMPGETWSLTDTLAPITIAGGYKDAGIVSNGIHQPGVGGGLSQMATTTYNVGFFMGLEDVEHRPHSYWFSRYPEGREATIFVGSIDMRFKNDTPYGILMQAYVHNNQLTVRGWSTPYYRVETTTSPRRNVVAATTTHSTAPGCTYQPMGSPGFTVSVTRKVFHKDELIRDEVSTWSYRPDHGVVCGKPPSQKKSDDKSDDSD